MIIVDHARLALLACGINPWMQPDGKRQNLQVGQGTGLKSDSCIIQEQKMFQIDLGQVLDSKVDIKVRNGYPSPSS